MANIKQYLDNIKNAIFGKDVRSSIHDGIEAINNEVVDNTDKQNWLEKKYDEQIKNMTLQDPSSAELVDARGEFDLLRDRLENSDDILNKKPYFFNTIAEMKASNKLKNRDVAQTLGYYEANDGGGASYLIRTKTQNDVEDGGFIHFIDSTLVAELIIENNTINFKCIGAKEEDKDNNLYDNKECILKYINFINNNDKKYTLFVPSGIYGFSETELVSDKGFEIVGVRPYSQWKWTGTIFVPVNNNQNHIIKVGNTTQYTNNCKIDNICFSSAYFEYSSLNKCFKIQSGSDGKITNSNIKTILNYALDMIYTCYSTFPTLDFRYIIGGCFQMSSSWEDTFDKINIRNVWNLEGNLINFAENVKTLQDYPNITACDFNKIYIEAIRGTLINVESKCSFANNKFDLINVEPGRVEFFGDINFSVNDEEQLEYISQSILKLNDNCQFMDVSINNIQINNLAFYYTQYNSKNYIYDTILNVGYAMYIKPTINNISVVGCNKDFNIVYQNNENCSPYQDIFINNFVNDNRVFRGLYNVNKIYNLTVNNTRNIKQPDRIKNYNCFTIPGYESQYISTTREKGNLTYDKDCTNQLKIAVNFLNTSENSSINRIEMSGILPDSSKFYAKVKAPDGKTGNLKLYINQNNSKVKSVEKEIIGDGNYNWIVFDYSNNTIDFTKETTFTLFPADNTDFEFMLDSFYIK